MISKPFGQVSHDDLQALLANGVPESKTLEYKRELPDNTDKGKHAFLAAVASFANTDGGDLLYGIEAQDGIPVAIPGIGEVIADQVKLRLEETARTGIEPRLPKLELKFIPTPDGDVLLVRVPKSWAAPHRVTDRNSGPFYGRHSSGKFQMDVAELRTAFALSETVAQRIENFHKDRVGRILNHQTPVQIHLGAKIALHIVPLSAFTGREIIDMKLYSEQLQQFYPIGRTNCQNTRINLDGVLCYANLDKEGRTHAYTQVFRNGITEAVVIETEVEGQKYIHSRTYEKHLIETVKRYLDLLTQVEVSAPLYLYLSIIGLTGYTFRVPNGLGTGYGYHSVEADRHIICLPEVVVTEPTQPAHIILRQVFDMVWNAFGYPGSENYDGDGNWIV